MKTLKSLCAALGFLLACAVLTAVGPVSQTPAQIMPTDTTPLGCFRDQGDAQGTRGRDLNGYAYNAPNMTGAVCRAECAKRGFAYAATQYSSWCFCGNEYGRSGPADNCTMGCAGNPKEMCGGGWANNVYRTGLGPAGPTPTAKPEMEMQIDRPGSDYRSFDLPAANPALCQAQCMQEGQCVAWTYVNPGVQGPQARCWLKSSVPNPRPNTCCVSGVKTAATATPPRPPTGAGLINVRGATYGANCGVPANNVTGHVKQACDGRGTCDYRVDHRVIGDPAVGCQKNYTVTWTCGTEAQVRSASAPPEAGFGSLVQLACAGAPPTVGPVTPPPPPQALSLTGRWSANDGGTYYVRQVGNEVWWYGRSSDGGATWSNVFSGTLQGNRAVGRWADVPQGRIMNAGEMEITIASPDRFTATRKTGGFGGSEWTRQR